MLIGIPAADAVCLSPPRPVRMERRVLGSLYGSARPERDFPALLELYMQGRLPLDRLISAQLPLDAVESAFDSLRAGERRAGGARPGRDGPMNDASTGASARAGPARRRTAATSTW